MSESKQKVIPIKIIRRKSEIYEYFTTHRKSKEVNLSDLTLKRSTEITNHNEVKYSLINYLQSDMKRLLLDGGCSGSFWYNLGIILQSWMAGNVHIAIDSKNNAYGYLVGDDKIYSPARIDIVEVLPPYRGKGVGKFMIEEWEKSCLHYSKKSIDGFDGFINIYPLESSVEFWLKMGYKFKDDYRMFKKISVPVKGTPKKCIFTVE